ncbi:hypothetical protein LR48_Vigan06g109700 [Vigna angularis]|uniref:Uncharacterized protein n=1 Tax=Phaseolus angularis TaxID=3914 RepID=A0A0L9USU1_PHAAN|nr:hypothetical protein LR48_Vigan06g109700 [Vigna angularis]
MSVTLYGCMYTVKGIDISLGTEAYVDEVKVLLPRTFPSRAFHRTGSAWGVHPAGRERDEEKGQQREAPVADHVRPQVVAANANELVPDDVTRGEVVVEIGEGDVGLSLRILLSKGMSEVVTTTGKLFQFNTSADNPDVVHRKSENREPYRVFIEQLRCFFISPKDKIPLQSLHRRQTAPRKEEPSFHNLAPNHFNSSIEPHSIKSSQTPPHASIRKQRRGRWRRSEGGRREEGLAVVDEKNIPDQQQQQHQWRMNINNTSNEDDSGSDALGSGDDGESRTSGDDEEQSKPRRPEVEPAIVVGHLDMGTETTGAVVQWRGGEAKSSGERRGREVLRRDLGRRTVKVNKVLIFNPRTQL